MSPEFDVADTSYKTTVGNEVNRVQISVKAFYHDAKVTVSPEVAGDSDKKEVEVPLEVGENLFTVTVTAEDGTTQEYTLTITRKSA